MAGKKTTKENDNIGILILLVVLIPFIPFLLCFFILRKIAKKMDKYIVGYKTAKLMEMLVLLCTLAGSILTFLLLAIEFSGTDTPEFLSVFPTVIPFINEPITPILVPFIWCYAISLLPLLLFVFAYKKNCKQQKIENIFINDLASHLEKCTKATEIINIFKERITKEKISPEAVRIAYIKVVSNITLEILSSANMVSFAQLERIELLHNIIRSMDSLDNRQVRDNIQQIWSKTIEAIKDTLEKHEKYIGLLNNTEIVPECPPGAVLKSGEFCSFTQESVLYENMKLDVNIGVPLGLLPGNLSGNSRLYGENTIPYENLKFLDIGNIIITNKRLLFISTSISRSFKLNEIISISAGNDGIQITRENKVRPEVFSFGDIFHTQLFITILKNAIQQISNQTKGEII